MPYPFQLHHLPEKEAPTFSGMSKRMTYVKDGASSTDLRVVRVPTGFSPLTLSSPGPLQTRLGLHLCVLFSIGPLVGWLMNRRLSWPRAMLPGRIIGKSCFLPLESPSLIS
jgi:hypothetical protein